MKQNPFRYHHQIYSTPNKNSHYSHMHSDYELFFFFNGDVDYIIGGSTYHLRANDLLFIKPSQYHCLKVLSLKPYEWTHINFPLELLTPQNQCLVPELHEVYHIPSNHPIKLIFDSLKDTESVFTEEEFLYHKKTSLNLILSHIKYIEQEKIQQPDVRDARLHGILQYIDANIESPITTKILADTFFVSPSWVEHTLKKHLNISVKQYINQKKILHAQQLIYSGVTATKAAELCSYVNYSTFFRQYKYFLGKDPLTDKPKNN
ncbi:MAG: helix-turn-helix transcriptional regulator [Clostridia bacterium]|nr:helix-turn-helix transcriptional regulator [Clostridia bacterium]